MTTWLEAAARLRAKREPGVLVTVTHTRGHAPREAGAKMVVSAGRTWASIGGGNLEEQAVRRARTMIARAARAPESFTASLSDKAPYEHGVQCCGGEATVLLEPLPVVPSVAVFGVGHVGLEVARLLSRFDVELHLVDSRPGQLDEAALAPMEDAVAAVHPHLVPVIPELVLAELPPGTRVLVMTHDHAEDLAIVDAALRCSHLGPVGLIGSAAKWARFRTRLAEAGFEPADLDRVECPVGLPELTSSKEPAAIAVAVVARWLATLEREQQQVAQRP